MAVTNTYDSFEFEKVGDYLPSYDQRRKEEEVGYKLEADQLKENNAQHIANGKIFGKTVKAFENLSTTAIKLAVDQKEKDDQEFQNRAARLINEHGLENDDKIKYEKDNKDNLEAASYYNYQASLWEAEALQPGADTESLLEAAKTFRGLSGRQEIIMNQALVMQEASMMQSKFWDPEEGITSVSLPPLVEGGEERTWLNSPESKQDLIDRWLDTRGLNNVSKFSDPLLEKNFWNNFNRQKNALIKSEYIKDSAAAKQSRIETDYNMIELAGNTGNLAEIFQNIMLTNWTDHGATKSAARTSLINKLDEYAIAEKLSPAAYQEFLETKIPAKGQNGKLVPIGELWKKEFGDIGERIESIQTKIFENKEKSNDALRNTASIKLDNWVKENDGIITEAQIAEFKRQWRENPETKNLPFPEALKTWDSNTVEDGLDQELIAKWNAQDGPIGDEWRKLNDLTLRAEYAKLAQSPGGGANPNLKRAKEKLGLVVKDQLQLDYGESGNTNTWDTIKTRAVASYKNWYAQGAGKFKDDNDRHMWALENATKEVREGTHNIETRDFDTSEGHSNRMNQILTSIIKDKNVINTGLLPTTQKEYKKLEAFANDPTAGSIPEIYYHIATKMNIRDSNGRRLDGYDVANAQYKSQTGKELPRIGSRENFLRKAEDHKSIKNFWNFPSANNRKQAQVHVNEGGDFTNYTLPGIEPVAA